MQRLKSFFLFLCLLFSLQAVHSQVDPAYEKLKTEMWSNPDFNVTEVPEKWKNESAVVLAKSYDYQVRKEVIVTYITEKTALHKRIKLLDKAAVNEFSEFSFENDNKNISIWSKTDKKDVKAGIKVIKPDGKVHILDMSEGVLGHINEGSKKIEYKKMAIPDLEVGDIIDYFYVINKALLTSSFEPVLYKLMEQYPIMSQKLNVRILRKIYFNARSINGAPELKVVQTDDENLYTLIDTDREKMDANLWTSPYRIYPTVKFQAFYVYKDLLKRYDYLNFFLTEKKTVNSTVDLDQMNNLGDKIYNSELFNYMLIDETKNYLKEHFDKTTAQDTIVKYSYYYLRQYADKYDNNSLMLNFSKVLQTRKIPHDLVITIPNSLSDVSDLVLPSEMAFLLRIKAKPDYFISHFSLLSTLKSISNDYQGNNAYAIVVPVDNPGRAEKIVIPVDLPLQNKEITNLHVQFAENSTDSLQISLDKTITGLGRSEEIGIAVTKINYLREVKNYLNVSKSEEKEIKAKQKKEEKLIADQQQKDVELAMKNLYQSAFEADDDFKLDSYTLKNSGVWNNSPGLQYNVCFKTGNLVKKMGPNSLISIGKLITQQLELSKKDLVRKVDIYSPYPREFEYNITFEIPSGYKVMGLEKINTNIANLTGGFISKAEEQNNKLVINVKKYYNHSFEKAAQWTDMTEFIEAAYYFTQQNILLEKKL